MTDYWTHFAARLSLPSAEQVEGGTYIADWLKILRDDKRKVFRAATDAQRIADYLLAFHPAYPDRARPPASASSGERQTRADLAEAA